MVCSKSSRKPVGKKKKESSVFPNLRDNFSHICSQFKRKIKALQLKMDELFIANNVAIKHRLLVT